MNKTAFFDAIRASLFTGGLTQPQVDGIEALLSAFHIHTVTDVDHAAYILANVHRETGGYMYPIKETVYESHHDKNPSDATVIARLDRAWARGQLPWVRSPYWREGWFGRGMIQITHHHNYVKLAERLGFAFDKDPSLTLVPLHSARIAVVGMTEGLFTGRKLSSYVFPTSVSDVPSKNPRRIVNGQDGTDAEVAQSYRKYRKALSGAGYSEDTEWQDAPAFPSEPPKLPEEPSKVTFVGLLLKAVRVLLK